MATNPLVSSKLHYFCVVSYLANPTAVPYVAFFFSKNIGWIMKNVVVSAEGQAAHKVLRDCFSNSGLCHIYCSELAFTSASAVQERMNLSFHKTAIQSTISTSLLQLLDRVTSFQGISMKQSRRDLLFHGGRGTESCQDSCWRSCTFLSWPETRSPKCWPLLPPQEYLLCLLRQELLKADLAWPGAVVTWQLFGNKSYTCLAGNRWG